MHKVLVTGPESSGKSFLTKALSKFFNGYEVMEYSRAFLANKESYVQADLVTIALEQFNSINRAVKLEDKKIVFCDTGIEVIKIWSSEKFGNIDRKLVELEQQIDYDLILLCKPNIPWVYDELRENENDRDRLFLLYEKELKNNDATVCIINEEISKRESQAISYIKENLNI